MSLLVDTSFLYALADVDDEHHTQVVEVSGRLTDALLLPTVVLPELSHLLNKRLGHPTMQRFLGEIADSGIQLEPLTNADYLRAIALLKQYTDARLDFVDAAIIAIAERRGITRILTLDRRDFSIVRPRHTPHFDILPLGNEEMSLEAGQTVLIPAPQPHKIWNIGSDALEFMAVCVPAWEPTNSVFLE